MKILFSELVLLLASFVAVAAPAAENPAGWRFEELRRISAPEAKQGVAADAEFLYAIGNHVVAKYRKADGARVAVWECPEGDPLIHLNAGLATGGRLYCAHSNYPGVPNLSSVEVWDTRELRHVDTHSFGRADGSLTWIDRKGDGWLACFVHYAKKGGEPGRGPEWSRVVAFDDQWRETGSWAFPSELIARVGVRGYSISGGALGPGGFLYATGHDAPELYVLAFPEAGPFLRWIATIPIPVDGQAFCCDPSEPGSLCLVDRKNRELVLGRLVGPETGSR